MSSPFVTIMPPSETHLFYLLFLSSLFLFSVVSGRAGAFFFFLKSFKSLYSGFFSFAAAGMGAFAGGLFFLVAVSLVPFSVIGLHFPLLGVGLSISIWVSIFLVSSGGRSFQSKKEFFGDGSLSWVWVSVSVGIESISRAARAITLGARISVNIMMGGILHSVIGTSENSLGLFVLCGLELLVVFIQTYVFSLLISLYSLELE